VMFIYILYICSLNEIFDMLEPSLKSFKIFFAPF
jgi:hypothetical protein